MAAELVSTSRPTGLRLLGALAVLAGAAAVGIAATRRWASVGFVDDASGASDVAVHGTDLWEGKVVLLGAAVALVLLLVLRVATSSATRRVVAGVLIVLGLAAAVIATVWGIRAEERLSGLEGIDRLAEEIARVTGDAEDIVREALVETLLGSLRVETGIAVWICAAGGIVLAAGGALGLAWVRRTDRDRAAEPSGGAATVS